MHGLETIRRLNAPKENTEPNHSVTAQLDETIAFLDRYFNAIRDYRTLDADTVRRDLQGLRNILEKARYDAKKRGV